MKLLLFFFLPYLLAAKDDPISYTLEANYKLDLGNYDEALGILLKGFQKTRDPFLLHRAVEISYEGGEYRKCISLATLYTQKYSPEQEIFKLAINSLLKLEGKKKQVLSWGKRALALFNQEVTFLEFLAEVFDRIGETETSRSIYEKLSFPDSLTFKIKLAYYLYKSGEIDSALVIYNDIYDSSLANYELEIGIARAYERLDSLEDALSHYMKAQAIDPSNLSLVIKIGQLQLRLKRLPDALKIFSSLKEIRPFDPDIRRLLGITYYESDMFKEAGEEFLTCIALDDKGGDSYYYLARIAYTLGDLRLSYAYLKEAKTRENKLDYVLFNAYLSISQNQPQKAIALLKKWQKEKNSYFASLLAYAYNMLNQDKEAEKYFKVACDLAPGDPKVLKEYALFLIRHERYPAATLYLEKATTFVKDDRELIYNLAMAYAQGHEIRKADSLFGILAITDSLNPLFLNNWGYFLADLGGDLNKALELIEKAIALDPDNPVYLDSVGWVYFKLGKLALARSFIERSIDLGADDPEIYQHMGKIYQALGELKQAQDFLNRANNLKKK